MRYELGFKYVHVKEIQASNIYFGRWLFGFTPLYYSFKEFFNFVNKYVDKIEKNEMGWACGTYG